MTESDYAAGGYIPGPPVRVTLHPDECIVRPGDPYTCIRADHGPHLPDYRQELP